MGDSRPTKSREWITRPEMERARRSILRRGSVALGALVLLLGVAGCAESGSPHPRQASTKPGLVGREPVEAVHLLENHSSALVAWRRAGVKDRIVVHLDGHADLDWLPDATVARIAAASFDELPNLELDPYAMDGTALSRFGIWNWLYPAARLGIIREMVWVVPDGTLADQSSQVRLVREILLDKIQMIGLEEARSLRPVGKTIQGTLIGLPVTICELADLPEIREPVLLDVDIDYFTTRSASTQEVLATPWISPEAVVESLAFHHVRSDLVTLSLSTLGGYLPPENRWLGRALRERLHGSEGADPSAARKRAAARKLIAEGNTAKAAEVLRLLAAENIDDGSLWYSLADSLEAAGKTAQAREARERAALLDPVLGHYGLFEADRLWLNGAYDQALPCYRRYLERSPRSPFAPYAMRREAGCLMRLQRDAEAIAAFRRVIEVAPEHADSHLDLGMLLRRGGMVDEALAELRKAARILPERAVYSAALGSTWLMKGGLEEGAANLEAAVARQPCLAQAQGNLAMALFQLGRYDQAAAHLQIALAYQPNSPLVRQLAVQLGRRGIPLARVSAQP